MQMVLHRIQCTAFAVYYLVCPVLLFNSALDVRALGIITPMGNYLHNSHRYAQVLHTCNPYRYTCAHMHAHTSRDEMMVLCFSFLWAFLPYHACSASTHTWAHMNVHTSCVRDTGHIESLAHHTRHVSPSDKLSQASPFQIIPIVRIYIDRTLQNHVPKPYRLQKHSHLL